MNRQNIYAVCARFLVTSFRRAMLMAGMVGLVASGCGSAWGFNSSGAYGDGTTTTEHSPVPAGGAGVWKVLDAGWAFSCGVSITGALYCFGNNFSGQLGDGTTTNRLRPTQESTQATNWRTVSASSAQSTCGVRTDGTLYCWGQNPNGKLGDGTTTDRHSPVQESTQATNWSIVNADAPSHSCGIRTDGTLYCWGYNFNGPVGDGTMTERHSPVQEATQATWSKVSTGGFSLWEHSCGVRTDGTLHCWGSNIFGQLGAGAIPNSTTPVQIGTATNWKMVSAGGLYTCAVRTDGTLYCWGSNSFGQLGDGTTTASNTPVQVGTATNWSSVSAGGIATCGRRTDGTVYCWGHNGGGKLGDGTTTDRHSPVQVGSATDWFSVSAGNGHTIGIRG